MYGDRTVLVNVWEQNYVLIMHRCTIIFIDVFGHGCLVLVKGRDCLGQFVEALSP